MMYVSRKLRWVALAAVLGLSVPVIANGDGKFVPFKYGNFDTWVTRQIHESAVI